MENKQDKPIEFYGRDQSDVRIDEKTVKKPVYFFGLSPELRARLDEVQTRAAPSLDRDDEIALTHGQPAWIPIGAELSQTDGIGGEKVVEAQAAYIAGPSETLAAGSLKKNNSYICFGKDRPSTPESGYGGLGHTQASAINIVAGPMGFLMKSVKTQEGKTQKLNFNPSFEFDAARIYLSQKADIDGYMGLQGSPGAPVSTTRSAIALRSDVVRVTARENIRLVTGFGEGRESDYDRKFNSQGSRSYAVRGIDLVAGNDTSDMQPLVKGDNLAMALDTILKEIKSLAGIVRNYIQDQVDFNNIVVNHSHISNVPGNVSGPNGNLIQGGTQQNIKIASLITTQLKVHVANLDIIRKKYLTKGPITKHYINSLMNHTN